MGVIVTVRSTVGYRRISLVLILTGFVGLEIVEETGLMLPT